MQTCDLAVFDIGYEIHNFQTRKFIPKALKFRTNLIIDHNFQSTFLESPRTIYVYLVNIQMNEIYQHWTELKIVSGAVNEL